MSHCAEWAPGAESTGAAFPSSPYHKDGPDRFRCTSNERRPSLCKRLTDAPLSAGWESWEEAFGWTPSRCPTHTLQYVHVLERALTLPAYTVLPLGCVDRTGRVALPRPRSSFA